MPVSRDELKRFQRVGRMLYCQGLVDSHSGNLSERDDGGMWITRAGAMLGELESADLVRMSDPDSPEMSARASSELIVHQAIYGACRGAQAVLHAHPTFATVLAGDRDALQPFDSESELLLGASIPVVAAEPPSASPQVALAVSMALVHAPAVIVRRHGAFVASDVDLEDALKRMSGLEHAARLLYYRALQADR